MRNVNVRNHLKRDYGRNISLAFYTYFMTPFSFNPEKWTTLQNFSPFQTIILFWTNWDVQPNQWIEEAALLLDTTSISREQRFLPRGSGHYFVFSLAPAPTFTIVTLLSTFHVAKSLFLPIVSVISSLYDEGIKISWHLDSDGEQDFVSDWRTLWLFQGKRTAVWIMILYFLRSRQVFWTVYWLKIWLMINMVATDDYKTTTQHMPILEIFQK